MGTCKSCGEESGKYDLCEDCYKKSKQNNHETQKKTKISDSSIKGRLAEAIVEEMFLAMGYRIFRFGMENTVPGFGDRYLPRKGDVADEVRKMPDFIVVKNSQVNYVEVKYRTSGEFDFNSHYAKKGGYPYKNAFFILVTPKYIKVQKASELEKGKDFIFLNKCKELETDKKIILQYIEFCKKFFGNC